MLDICSSQFDRGICAGKKGGNCWRDGFDNFFRRFVDGVSKVVRGKVRDLFVQVVKSVIANFRNMLAGVYSLASTKPVRTLFVYCCPNLQSRTM